MEKLGIYIHWPFCRSKCPYCDFFSEIKKDVSQSLIINDYIDDLKYYRSLNDNYKVDSIFFGGGTPSLIEPEYIVKLIDTIKELWQYSDDMEISLEANPNTNQPNLFKDLKSAGINRLSLGVQALNDADLKFLGRTHSLKDAELAIDSVLKNFDNHSMDLIYARPNHSEKSWEEELLKAANFGFKHLSLYQLTIEKNTPFAKLGIKPSDDENALKLYHLSADVLNQNGYCQYEISNYAKKSFECRHNNGYWTGDDYIGVGKGAVGYVHSNNKLFATTHRRQMEEVSPEQRAEELIIMGLRRNDGIDKNNFRSKCGLDFIHFINSQNLEQLKKDGLIVNSGQYLRVTEKGRLLLNYVIERLCF